MIMIGKQHKARMMWPHPNSQNPCSSHALEFFDIESHSPWGRSQGQEQRPNTFAIRIFQFSYEGFFFRLVLRSSSFSAVLKII